MSKGSKETEQGRTKNIKLKSSKCRYLAEETNYHCCSVAGVDPNAANEPDAAAVCHSSNIDGKDISDCACQQQFWE